MKKLKRKYIDYNELETGDLLLFHWKGKKKNCLQITLNLLVGFLGSFIPFDFENHDSPLLNCCLSFYGKLISCFTKSKYTHSAIIVRDPPWCHDLKGLYILESSLETFPDAEDNEIKFGVQLVDFHKMMNDFLGDVYVRRLNCKRDDNFNNNLIKAQSITHN